MSPRRRRLVVLLLVAPVAVAAGAYLSDPMRRVHVASRARSTLRTDAPLETRLAEVGPRARERWSAPFRAAGVAYPPERVVLLGLKEERRLDVLASDGGPFRFVRSIPILGASGRAGPKLREGDRQVPEGIYACELLNPNSSCHVSLRVGYPNADDRRRAAAESRRGLGGDIMIHGGSMSVGCLAIGDDPAEDVFVLAADVGLPQVEIVIAPRDLRSKPEPAVPAGAPAWTRDRWKELRDRMTSLPPP